MREILEANGLNSSGSESDAALHQRCQGLTFYGSLEKCPVCKNGNMEYTESYYCECATCPFNTISQVPIRVVKAIHPTYREPVKVGMTVIIYEDGVEINGWRLNKSIFSNYRIVHGVFAALIGFFLFNIWSKMCRG